MRGGSREELRLEDEIARYGHDAAKLERGRRIAGFDRRRAGPPHVAASGASVPAAVRDQPRADRRDLRLMPCGIGIGLSRASCPGSFSGMHISGVHDFLPSGAPIGRKERIARRHPKCRGEDNG